MTDNTDQQHVDETTRIAVETCFADTGKAAATDVNPFLSMNNAFNDQKSRWEAMRLKKHFTIQTQLMLKPNETSYVGAFAVSTELRTIKKSPLSFIPFAKQLFSRTEFMLIKSAILVFVTARYAAAGQLGNSSSQRIPVIQSEQEHLAAIESNHQT